MELDIQSKAEISGSEKKKPTISIVIYHLVHLNSHLEVYIVRHTHCTEKKTQSVLAQTPMSLFAISMDSRIYHFHRTVKYLENKCPKIRILNRIIMMIRRIMIIINNDNNNNNDINNNNNEILRRDYYVKRLTGHMAKVPLRGGGGRRGPFLVVV